MFYVEQDNKIVLFDESRSKIVDTVKFIPEYQHLEIKETNRPIIDFEFADTPEWEEKQRQKERERLDALTLTPSDVERALYKAKGMDFEDLKALIQREIPTLDMKELAIEFRANNFYRGVEINGIRLIDAVGQLLSITSEQLDKFFQTKDYHYLMDEDNNDL